MPKPEPPLGAVVDSKLREVVRQADQGLDTLAYHLRPRRDGLIFEVRRALRWLLEAAEGRATTINRLERKIHRLEQNAASLHVYGDDAEWVIAYSLGDARSVYEESSGAKRTDEDFENWEQEPDDQMHTIWCDSSEIPTEPHSEGSQAITLSNAAWCARLGRGYLCTTEY